MKPAEFDYRAPRKIPEVLSLLAELGADAKVLAGGQSLVQLMNMRAIRPAHVIDINCVDELAKVSNEEGTLRLGSIVRQAEAQASPLVAEVCPLLEEAIPFIGSPQVRNRGTIGGSLAYANPMAELPAVAVALEAEIVLSSQRRQRIVTAPDFFVGPFATVMEPDEFLMQIRIPFLAGGTGWSFKEVSRRKNDLPLAAAAAVLRFSEDSTIGWACLALAGAGPTPVRCFQAEQDLTGEPIPDDGFAAVAERAVANIDPPGDMHATGAYRKALAEVLVVRTLQEAAERAWMRSRSVSPPSQEGLDGTASNTAARSTERSASTDS